MSYKVKHENEHSFVVEHPDGSHFTVAKKGLGANSLKKIQKLAHGGEVQDTDEKGPVSKDTANAFAQGLGVKPDLKEDSGKQPRDPKKWKPEGYASGGWVEDAMDDPNAVPGGPASGGLPPGASLEDIDTTSERTLSPFLSKPLEILGQSVGDVGNALGIIRDKATDIIAPKNPNYVAPKVEEGPSTPQEASKQPLESTTLPQDASAGSSETKAMGEALKNPMEASYGMLKSGIQQEAKAQADLGKAQADALQGYMAKAQEAQKGFETKRAVYTEARDKAFNEAMEGKVDPNHYWTTQGTASKVSTIIGLVLGGIGGGMQGNGGNVALEMLNKQIDRDIEAQKSNIGQKNNLYKFNLERLKDEDEAYAVTRNQLAAMSAAQLQLAAAKSQDPMAKARATQALGQLKQQYDNYNQQLALQKATLQGSDPVTAKISLLLPKEQHKEAFEELGIYNNMKKGLATIDDAFNTVAKTGSIKGSMPFSDAKAGVEAAKSAIMANVQAMWKGPMSDTDLARIDGLLPRLTDTPSQGAMRNRQLNLVVRANAKPTPLLSGRGWLPQDKGPIRTGAPVLKK